jgi:phosphatidylinositol phospholipase C delta
MSYLGNVVVEGFVPPIAPSEKALKKFNQYNASGMKVLLLSSGPKERVFRISDDGRHLSYTRGWKTLFSKMVLPFDDVLSIQPGQHVQNFHRFPEYKPSKPTSFALIYKSGKNIKSLAIVCENADQYGYFFGTVLGILDKIKETRASTTREMQYLQRMWIEADSDNKGSLSFSKIKTILQQCNIDMPNKQIEAKFKKVDLDNSNSLDFNEFVFFVDLLRRRKELHYIWLKLVDKEPIVVGEAFPLDEVNDVGNPAFKAHISMKEFHAFLTDYQKQKGADGKIISLEETKKRLHDALAKTGGEGTSTFDGEKLDYHIFKSYLKSEFNGMFDSTNRGALHHDMTQPLSHYYIASSHNTYLEGDQLASNSSTQRYISDLLEGCRCVELDCWDGPNNEPIITHGHTACSTITFRDAISAIDEYGFVNSPYPIILSIEQHCGLDQQKVQVDIMKATFKDKLQPRMTNADAPGATLPSPEELKFKILIKGKREDGKDDDDDDDDDVDADVAKATAAAEALSKKSDKAKKAKVYPEMSAITYLGTGKVKKFDATTLALPCDMMCSYSETTTLKNLEKEDKVEGWVKHNRTHLSRIYPMGLRINSSNYMPTPAWCAGNQLVALNYQTGDEAMFCNRAKFQENGACGYLLKTEAQRQDDGEEVKPIKLVVHVLGGSSLPKPGGEASGEIIDPFVVVSIDGHPGDKAQKQTSVIDNNGFDPMWNECFEFDIKRPDAACLSFQVRDDDTMGSDFVAQSTVSVPCLQQGTRSVPLSDKDGTMSGAFQFATLWVALHIKEE